MVVACVYCVREDVDASHGNVKNAILVVVSIANIYDLKVIIYFASYKAKVFDILSCSAPNTMQRPNTKMVNIYTYCSGCSYIR